VQTTRWNEMGRQRDWSNRVRVRGPMLRLAWVEFLGWLPWELFVTLTFDPKKTFPVDAAKATREALVWCGHLAWALRTPIAWLVAPERGSSGMWHVHVLLIGTGDDISAIVAPWRVRNGNVDVRPVHERQGAVLYSTKEAALTGDVVLSDTLIRYRPVSRPTETVVRLYTGDDADE
jgi:hypothetical protein